MLGMKNHFDISDSIKIREVDIAKVACIINNQNGQNSACESSTRFILIGLLAACTCKLVSVFMTFRGLWNFCYLTFSHLNLSLPFIGSFATFRIFTALVILLLCCFSQLSINSPVFILSPLAIISDF